MTLAIKIIQSVSVIWDDIIFEKDEIRLKPDSPRVNSIFKSYF